MERVATRFESRGDDQSIIEGEAMVARERHRALALFNVEEGVNEDIRVEKPNYGDGVDGARSGIRLAREPSTPSP
jgi:hypothetical protein